MKKITMYTDGACSGNPGPGGYGTILIYKGIRKELSEGFRDTTNNRMELMAVIRGLEALKEKCSVEVFSDSKYVVDGMRKGWARKWLAAGWRRGPRLREKVKNPDLWERLLKLCDHHVVEFSHVTGHAGQPENERCDQLAVLASKK